MDKAQTEKPTCRTGRRSGLKDSPRISIAVNDADKVVSRLWNKVKDISSRRKETAAETARRVLIRGLLAELEEITLATEKSEEKELERLQGNLFND